MVRPRLDGGAGVGWGGRGSGSRVAEKGIGFTCGPASWEVLYTLRIT